MGKIKVLKNNQGSILVGSVALAMLMALAGTGFLLVTANSVNSETAALENEKAFQAAESGVWIGARWLRVHLNDGNSFPSTTIPINGMNVYVTITKNGSPVVASINSEVYKGSQSASTFKKRIRVGNITGQNFGVFTTFYNGYQSDQNGSGNGNGHNGDWDASVPPGHWKPLAQCSWMGWGNNRIFNGRMHVNNMPIELNSNGARFNGYVTVARGSDGLGASFKNGQRGNSYDSGIVTKGYTPASPSELDAVFTDRYIPNADPIVLNVADTSAASLNANAALAQKTTLDDSWNGASVGDGGYGPGVYRPTLYFDGSTAYYQYKDASGTCRVKSWNPIDGTIFLSLHNNLNVYSTSTGVIGNITIATAPGNSIVPVGNLTVNGYNFGTGAIDNLSTNNNMIGLISGEYIAFNKTWVKQFNTDGAPTTKYVSEQVTGGAPGVAPGSSNTVGMLHMTASIMAVCHFTDNLLNTDGIYQNYPMVGTEWWDGMWDCYPAPGPGSTAFNNTLNRTEDYGFQLYGNHILGGYSRSIYNSAASITTTINTFGRGCAGTITFNHDPRMSDRNLQPPGFPGVKNGTTLLTLRLRNWSEENKYN